MEHIENAKPGRYLMVLESLKSYDMYGNPFEDTRSNGVPLKILAVSPPFIMCETWTNQVTILDTRKVEIGFCNRKYVQVAREKFHTTIQLPRVNKSDPNCELRLWSKK